MVVKILILTCIALFFHPILALGVFLGMVIDNWLWRRDIRHALDYVHEVTETMKQETFDR